jgi:hypothetical protein
VIQNFTAANPNGFGIQVTPATGEVRMDMRRLFRPSQ